jgi:hypothetical protein
LVESAALIDTGRLGAANAAASGAGVTTPTMSRPSAKVACCKGLQPA